LGYNCSLALVEQERHDSARIHRQMAAIDDFLHRLATVKVLDAAYGSGNFLYVAINLLLDLEKQVITYGAEYEMETSTHEFSTDPTARTVRVAETADSTKRAGIFIPCRAAHDLFHRNE